MDRRCSSTENGDIYYWISTCKHDAPWLVFLPGLTADHNLFESQIQYFSGKVNFMTWDAPAHGESRPWSQPCGLDEMAQYLLEIFEREGITQPVLVGQSLGGYLAQVFMYNYPGFASGFVSINSAPIRRVYYSTWELVLLKHTFAMSMAMPWKSLVKSACRSCSATKHGRDYMRKALSVYEKREYCKLVANSYEDLANVIAGKKPFWVNCPMLAICGRKDETGHVRKYNRHWVKREGIEMLWLSNAGHNSNMDAPEAVNDAIDRFAAKVWQNPF